jgi:hypothetical protein
MYHFWQKWVWLKFGQYFHKLVWSPCIPFSEVVTLAVYSYLLSTLFGSQFLDPSKKFSGEYFT